MPSELQATFTGAVGNPDALDINQAKDYTSYDVDTEYLYDPGFMVLPVASVAAKTVKVQYHGGHGKRIVKFAASKRGNPPVVPAPGNINEVTVVVDPITNVQSTIVNEADTLVGASAVVPIPVINTQTGSYDWRIAGTYVYVTKDDPRIPGRDQLPTAGRPAPVQPQDTIAQATLNGASTLEQVDNRIALNDLQAGTYIWPFTVYPANWFNPNLLSA